MSAKVSAQEWEDRALLDLVAIKSGQVDPRDAPFRDLPLIAPDHLASQTGRLIKKESAAAQGAISGKYLVLPGDVIYSKIRPYLQKAYKCDFKALCSADMYPLTPRTSVDSSFILHSILGRDFTNFAVSVSARSGIPKINREELAEYRMRVPCEAEQRAIGATLNDADELIATLERLVAKKQAIKQGMMQQLLTGRARLPGFTDDWRHSTVGGEFDVQLGKMLDAAKNAGVVKPYLGNRAVQWGRIDISAAGSVPMTPSDIHRYRLQAGDLLVCEGGEVGRAAIWRNDLSECYFQKALHRLRPKNGYDIRVMQALLELWSSVGSFADYVTQTSIAHLPREKFVEMPLPLPSIAEQTAIGDLVEDLDREIACVDRRIAKHRAIKQGMMQQLLTGRTRLSRKSA